MMHIDDPWAFMILGSSLTWIGLAIILVLIAAAIYFYSRSPQTWERVAGGPDMTAPAAGD